MMEEYKEKVKENATYLGGRSNDIATSRLSSQDHQDRSLHASGVDQGQSKGESGHSGRLNEPAICRVHLPTFNFCASPVAAFLRHS
jgi:hypothetical protein